MAVPRRAFLSQHDTIKLTAKQSNIYLWGWQPSARHRVAVCGRRFGKTFLAMKEIRRAAQLAAKRKIHPDNEIWYGAPTFKQAKRVFWMRLKRSIPRSWLACKPNESECHLTLVTGHIIRIVGLDNYDALRGSGLFFFIGDEWADAQEECWTEVIQPMLMTCGGNSLKIGTPKGFNHFHADFQKGQPGGEEDYKSWHYTSIQGGNIPDAEIERAMRELDPRTFEQEYRAGFVTYAGRVIYAFSRGDHVRPCVYDPKLPLHIGMDFNVNPMSATVWQEVDGASHEALMMGLKLPAGEFVSLQVGEVVIPTSDTTEMAEEIVRRYGRPSGNGHITIYPDPAGAQRRTSAQGKTDISILRDPQFGFKVMAMTSHPLVKDRNNTMNSRFMNVKDERRAFVDPSCKHSIEAYERHVYKEGTSEPEKTKGYDHLPDSGGYYFYVRFGGPDAAKLISAPHMGR